MEEDEIYLIKDDSDYSECENCDYGYQSYYEHDTGYVEYDCKLRELAERISKLKG